VEHDGFTYIFLTGARKNFHHEVPDDWENVAYERFDYVECGVWRKRTEALTEKDRSDWVEYRGEPDDEFVSPHNWTWPEAPKDIKPVHPDLDFTHAKAVYDRAVWQYMDGMRKGQADESWFDLANAVLAKWPDVHPTDLQK
jgi:hypothetical protein